MLKFAEKIWNQIRRGENIELYLLVTLTIVLIALDLTGFSKPEWLFSFTLAALALFAISLLGLRGQVERLREKLEVSTDDVFMMDYPEYMKKHIFSGKQILIIGIFLTTTMNEYQKQFEKLIKNDYKINFLIINPKNTSLLEYSQQRSYSSTSAQINKIKILESLRRMCLLREKKSSNVDIRTIDYIPNLGFYGVDTDTKDGIIFVEHYGYKLEHDQPKFVLKPQDNEWYELFKKQMDLYWKSGEQWVYGPKETEKMIVNPELLE